MEYCVMEEGKRHCFSAQSQSLSGVGHSALPYQPPHYILMAPLWPTHTHTRTHTHVHTDTHRGAHTHRCRCIYAHMHTHTHIYTQRGAGTHKDATHRETYTQTVIHTHTHTYIHTDRLFCGDKPLLLMYKTHIVTHCIQLQR